MTVRYQFFAGAIFLCACAVMSAGAQAQSGGLSSYGSPRQYYSAWAKHPTQDYHYRRLYYKPTANYVGYKHHYVITYPQKSTYCYYYNPYKKTYWGRCQIKHEGKYSMLAPQDRKSSVDAIPESAFPAPSDPPLLPDTDGLRLDLPPDDLPLN